MSDIRTNGDISCPVRWSEQQKIWVEDVWEPCPLHERTRCCSEHCKLCEGSGEVLIEVECDTPNSITSNSITSVEERTGE